MTPVRTILMNKEKLTNTRVLIINLLPDGVKTTKLVNNKQKDL